MSEPNVNPVNTAETDAPASTGKALRGNEAAAGYDSKTTVSSMQDLKDKAPKVYEAMVMGIATQITSQMRRANARLKKLMREGRRNN